MSARAEPIADRHETDASDQKGEPLCRGHIEGRHAREEHDKKHNDTAHPAQSIERNDGPCCFAEVVASEPRSGTQSSLPTEHADPATCPRNLASVVVANPANISFLVDDFAEVKRFGEQYRKLTIAVGGSPISTPWRSGNRKPGTDNERRCERDQFESENRHVDDAAVQRRSTPQ